jgi:FKBP-type peptidyl-prolyl cis-trans isomerase
MLGTMFMSCNDRKARWEDGEVDTLSYVVGMNVAYELLKMDSTLVAEDVCNAIYDVFAGEEMMTMEEARTFFLAKKTYFVHEQAKAYQERYLTDLSKRDRKYVRTRSGVTYKIIALGDQNHRNSMSMRDTVRIVYTMTDDTGHKIVDADTLRDSYRNLVKGLQELVKITGKGGHFNAWLPSTTAYGVEGNEKLNIAPNTMLNYDVQIIDIKYNR